jgi:hypothetical protein
MYINDMILLIGMTDFYQKCTEVVFDQSTRKDICYLLEDFQRGINEALVKSGYLWKFYKCLHVRICRIKAAPGNDMLKRFFLLPV